jgi:hypothetical protein
MGSFTQILYLNISIEISLPYTSFYARSTLMCVCVCVAFVVHFVVHTESGTIVVTETNIKKSNEVEYYPFLISHPKSSMVYRLSTTSKDDRDSWVAALNSLINKTALPEKDSSYVYSPSASIDSSSDMTEATTSLVIEKDDTHAMEMPEETLSHIPVHCRDQV